MKKKVIKKNVKIMPEEKLRPLFEKEAPEPKPKKPIIQQQAPQIIPLQHIYFPDDIRLQMGSFDFDIGICMITGGMCLGLALAGMMR